MPRRGAGRALAGLALAGLALAGAGAGAGARAPAGGVTEESFPCKVRVKGRNRGDPECTRTVWTLPRAQARRLGLKRRTVFRSCPSRRARRRAKRGGAPLTAHNLPGGEDRVLSGFLEEGPTSVTVKRGGFLWSALTYDEAEDPTMGVVRTEDRTLLTAERGPLEAARRSRRGTQMMCRTGTDNKVVAGVNRFVEDIVLKAEDYPMEDGERAALLNGEVFSGELNNGMEAAAVKKCEGNLASVDVLYELDSDFVVSNAFQGNAVAARDYVLNLGNLGSVQYAMQTGVELTTSVLIDTREGPNGHFYNTKGDMEQLNLFRERWTEDSFLKQQARGFSHVHLLSGKIIRGGTLGIAFLSQACSGNPLAVSWLSLLEDDGVACQTALMMHENGHTLSLDHVDDATAVMYPTMRCSQTFLPSSVSTIQSYMGQRLGGSSTGCSCSDSTTGSPPPSVPDFPGPEPQPPQQEFVMCEGLGKKFCKQQPGCIKVKAGCAPTRSNGAICASIPKKRWCRRAACRWDFPPDDYDYDYDYAFVESGEPKKRRRGGKRRRRQRKECQD